jgi:hypothetical protein
MCQHTHAGRTPVEQSHHRCQTGLLHLTSCATHTIHLCTHTSTSAVTQPTIVAEKANHTTRTLGKPAPLQGSCLRLLAWQLHHVSQQLLQPRCCRLGPQLPPTPEELA